MRPLILFVAGLLSVAATGCATGYHAEGLGGGYSDTQLDRTTFRITFKGSVGSRQGDTDEMALLHAAEVAKRNGYAFFVSSGSTPVGTAMSIATGTVGSPASTLTIVCFKERPDTTQLVYASDVVIETLGRKYSAFE
jgi:hypothetical protein